MKWEDLFAPAIKLAKEGFPIKKHFAKVLAKHETELSNSDIKSIFSGVRKEGDKLVQLELAKLLEDLSKKGADHFYNEVSKEIITGLGTDAVLTEDDFKKYKPAWSEPVTRRFAEYTLYAPPFPSSGVLLLELIPERAARLSDKLRQNNGTTSNLELLTASFKDYLANVLAKLPDLDGDAPDKGFPQLVKEIRDSIELKKRAKESDHPIVEDYGGVHLSIIKGFEAVTIISGINEPFGSKKASVPGLIMNNYMSAFAATADVPNGRKGKKQPRTSMVPVFAKNHEHSLLLLQAGAGGGIPGMWALAQVLNCISEAKVSFCIRSAKRILPTEHVSAANDPDIEATASGIFTKRPLVSWLAPHDNVHCDGTSDGENTTALKKMKATETDHYCKRTKECTAMKQIFLEVARGQYD
ncbi:scoloptoxin SSD14-like [Dermacentor silvarum]|uniref:scoloptoxin SSD14-like n=1 Tax=Dermacentor silvarum TaxID=543639 RepID=UPI00210186B6|nr:scoloptoxin SSD14-like [Dermacentor silvarum]